MDRIKKKKKLTPSVEVGGKVSVLSPWMCGPLAVGTFAKKCAKSPKSKRSRIAVADTGSAIYV